MLGKTKDPLAKLRDLLGGGDVNSFSLARLGIFGVQHPGAYSQTPVKFRFVETIGRGQRHTDPRLYQTCQLLLPDGTALLLFADPSTKIRDEHAVAEPKVAELESQQTGHEKNISKELDAIKVEMGIALDRGDVAACTALGRKAEDLTKALERGRVQFEMQLRDAREELARTSANVALLDKGIAHRHLRIEPSGGSADDRIICSEDFTVDLTKVDRHWQNPNRLETLPLNCLQYITPLELPSIADWIETRYEQIDPSAPASAGMAANELHETFLREHGLRIDQVSAVRFGRELTELGIAKKASATGNKYMLTVKLTEQQREAQLQAQWRAEKAEQERREFEAWKRSRAAAGAAGAGG
jgi:hypothetical protein